jgi:hypothetical protein
MVVFTQLNYQNRGSVEMVGGTRGNSTLITSGWEEGKRSRPAQDPKRQSLNQLLNLRGAEVCWLVLC